MSLRLTLGSFLGLESGQVQGLQVCGVQSNTVFLTFPSPHHLCNQLRSISYTEYSNSLSKSSLIHSIPPGPNHRAVTEICKTEVSSCLLLFSLNPSVGPLFASWIPPNDLNVLFPACSLVLTVHYGNHKIHAATEYVKQCSSKPKGAISTKHTPDFKESAQRKKN